MNNSDKEYFEGRFCKVEQKLERVHDDVLVLKTQRDSVVKFMYLVAGAVSLTISLVVSILRG
jgi:hypothetical protein